MNWDQGIRYSDEGEGEGEPPRICVDCDATETTSTRILECSDGDDRCLGCRCRMELGDEDDRTEPLAGNADTRGKEVSR